MRTDRPIPVLATIALLAAILAAGAASPGRNSAQEATGEWLLDVWEQTQTQSRFEFKREGAVIKWTLSRGRFQSRNPRWGEKAAVEASGTVTKISETSAELVGKYDMSDNRAHIGKPMKYELNRTGEDTLRGRGIGAANEWFPVQLRRVK
ncbi:MAG: hypothetical protein AAB016_03975 [candidate division NC10 bacterium]